MAEKEPAPKKIPTYIKFINSGLAGCGAILFCHPIDVVKNRMQLSGEGGVAKDHKSSFHAFKNIATNEGPLSLYDGFSANIARQLVYTTTRLGLFQVINDHFNSIGVGGLKAQVSGSLMAGGVASLIATPTDVALVRMTSDKKLPAKEQRKYKHVFDALKRITKEEGVFSLWTGVTPTVLRAMMGTVTQIVPYVQAKQYFLKNEIFEDNFKCHFVSSLVAGLTYAASTTPLDVMKTRMQNAVKLPDGSSQYKGLGDVFLKTLKNEGVTAFWKGFTPYYARIAPFTVLMFVFFEQLTTLYKTYVLQDRGAKGGL